MHHIQAVAEGRLADGVRSDEEREASGDLDLDRLGGAAAVALNFDFAHPHVRHSVSQAPGLPETDAAPRIPIPGIDIMRNLACGHYCRISHPLLPDRVATGAGLQHHASMGRCPKASSRPIKELGLSGRT